MTERTPAPADSPQAELLTQRYADQIVGTLGCWDRVILTGTLTDVCHAGAVEGWLRRDNIRCFDLKVFAEPLRDQVRDHALLPARAAGLAIEHLERRNFRKEDRVAEVLRQRGDAPGLVHVFSAMEACQAFKPWHDKTTGKTGLRPPPPANACTTTFISCTRGWGWCMCACPPGCPSGCKFISTVTTGWPAGCAAPD